MRVVTEGTEETGQAVETALDTASVRPDGAKTLLALAGLLVFFLMSAVLMAGANADPGDPKMAVFTGWNVGALPRICDADGTGGWTNCRTISITDGQPDGTSGVEDGDFNEDGLLDLVITNQNGTLNVCLGAANDTWSCSSNGSSGRHRGAAVADFNNDGNQDIVGTIETMSNMDVCLGDGTGGFSCSRVAAPNGGRHIAVADFTGNGALDMVYAAWPGPTALCENDGTATFTCTTMAGSSGTDLAAELGDFNGDGDPDVVLASYSGTSNVCLGDGASGFTCSALGAGTELSAATVDDFNNDGDDDVVVVGNTAASSCLGNGAGAFSCSAISGISGSMVAVDSGLANGDNNVDLLIGIVGVNASCLGDGVGGFTCATADTPSWNSQGALLLDATTLVDTDGDGVTDGSDNCPAVANANQANADGDSEGDLCDTDDDDDGLTDGAEATGGTDPLDPDSDGDTLDDGSEVNIHGTDPLAVDTDGDTLDDAAEVNVHGTDPTLADTDGDTLDDAAEVNVHGTDPLAADTDGDTLDDAAEVNVHGTDPTLADTDGDTLADGAEVSTHGSDPTLTDTDGDTLDDAAEVNTYGSDPTLLDTDGDTLDDAAEVNVHGTDPTLADTDGDTLDDAAEVNVYGTNPALADTDGDTLADGDEVNTHGSDPTLADTDGDTLDDAAEVNVYGTDPTLADTDGDTLDDAAEINVHSTDPTLVDTDGDLLDDADEVNIIGTDPTSADTDADTLDDGAEVNVHLSDPTLADTDGDTLDDAAEVNTHGTDPLATDTDGDTLDDAAEVNTHGTDPTLADSDSDTVDDGIEIGQGTDPLTAQNFQTITFAAPGDIGYQDVPLALSPTASSGLPVQLTVAGVCVESGGTITTDTLGWCTITATQPGDGSWFTADPVAHTFNLTAGAQQITFTEPTGLTYRDSPAALIASANSGLPVTATATGTCTVSPPEAQAVEITPVSAGDCTITLSQAGTELWAPPAPVSFTIRIQKRVQELSLGEMQTTVTFGVDPITITPAATSELPIDLLASGACQLVNNKLQPTRAGTCTVTATQGGNNNWLAAADVTKTITVEFAGAALRFDSQLSDVADEDLTPLVVVSEPADLDGITVLYDGESTVPTTPGVYAVTVTLENDRYEAEPLTAQYTLVDEEDTVITATAEELQTVGLPEPGEVTGRLQLIVTGAEPGSTAILRDPTTEVEAVADTDGDLSLYPPEGFDLAEATFILREPNGQRSVISTEDVLQVGDSTLTLDFEVGSDPESDENTAGDGPGSDSGNGAGVPVSITISGGGLPPGSVVEVIVRSEPISVGSVVVEGDGTFEKTLVLPTSLEPGEHRVLLQAEDDQGALTGTWFFALDESQEIARVGDPEDEPPAELAFAAPVEEAPAEVEAAQTQQQQTSVEPQDAAVVEAEVEPEPIIDNNTGLVVYEPMEEPEESIETGVNAIALMTVVATAGGSVAALSTMSSGGMPGGPSPMSSGNTPGARTGSQPASGSRRSGGSDSEEKSGGRSRGKGKIASGKAGALGSVAEAAAWGDASPTWRWPLVTKLDNASYYWPDTVRPYSPMLSRIIADGSTLRASMGTAALLAPLFGVILGALAVVDTGGQAIAPATGLMVALILLGIFDAAAGFTAALVFIGVLAVSGSITSADSVRTLMGVGSLWFAVPLVAGGARKFRRPPAEDWAGRWSKLTDVVVGSLLGAWTVQTVLKALPGLAGLELPISTNAQRIAGVTLVGLLLRYLSEWVHGRTYPERLAAVSGLDEREPGMVQKTAATVMKGAIMVFILVPYIGLVWQLALVVGMATGPQLIGLYKDRFPHSDFLFRILPKGVPNILMMMVIGKTMAAYLGSRIEDPVTLTLTAFVVLSVPGFVAGVGGLFGRDGDDLNESIGGRIAGLLVAVVAIMTIRGSFAEDPWMALVVVAPAFVWWVAAAIGHARLPKPPEDESLEGEVHEGEIDEPTPVADNTPIRAAGPEQDSLADRLPDVDEVLEKLQADSRSDLRSDRP